MDQEAADAASKYLPKVFIQDWVSDGIDALLHMVAYIEALYLMQRAEDTAEANKYQDDESIHESMR